MKKSQNLPVEHHVIRYVPFSKLRKDENDKVIGILGTAYQLREGEEALSATYVEYFAGNQTRRITRAVWAIRASSIKVGGKAGFAIAQVDHLHAACRAKQHKIRIVYEPEDDNMAHCAVRRMPREDAELLENLASDVWSELVMNSEIPAGQEAAPVLPE